jgi:DNA-binding transcriptional MerR regulator
MGKYSITDLEKLSGIKAHTIRIWEQRYNLLQPLRTSTNIRYYDDDQLKKLLNVSSILRNGMKISQISNLSEEELHVKLESVIDSGPLEAHFEIYINQLITSGLTYDEPMFEKIFSTCLLRYGLPETYIHIIYPLLDKLGLMWNKDQINPAQEHFVSNLLKQKLFTAIDGLPPVSTQAPTFVLFLPEEEDHEMGLLFANYLLRLNKLRVIYLGQRVPFVNLIETVNQCKADYLMTFIVKSQPVGHMQKYIQQLSLKFNKSKILLSGNHLILSKISFPVNVSWLQTIQDFTHSVIPSAKKYV